MRARQTFFHSVFLTAFSITLALSINATAHPGGVDPAAFPLIDDLFQTVVDAGNTPGVALAIGRCPDSGPDVVLYAKAYGHRVGTEPLTLDTLYDLASVTKPTFTASAALLLIQDGAISDEDTVSTYIPGFEQNDKGDVKIKHLLTHTSGLAAYTNVYDLPARPNPDALIGKISAMSKQYTTGEGYVYSCLNFITLARIVENVSGETVTSFLKRRLWDKIGMIDSTHFPTADQIARTAPTLRESSRPRGRVHDPLAWYYTDYENETHACGNAGGFSTVLDEARLARLILRGGTLYGKLIFTPETIDLLSTRQTTVASRSYGWDTTTSYYGQVGQAIRHSGYTGTYVFIDLASDTYLIIFANHVYPDDSSANRTATRDARDRTIRTLLDHLDYYNDVPEEAYVVDNDEGAPGYTESGAWLTSTADGYQSKTYRYATAGTAAWADYALQIPTSGEYRLYAWYRAHETRATSCQYVIDHRSGSDAVSINQQENNEQWVLLGTYDFDAGAGRVRVDAENSSGGTYVAADAIMVEAIAPESDLVVDNSDAGFSATANFATSSASPWRYGEDYHYCNPGAGDTATWTLPLPAGGVWEILEWHNGNETRSDRAPFTISHFDGETTVLVNQQQDSGRWLSLGRFAFDRGAAQVRLASVTDKIVIADAVRARLVPYEVLVDDLDARYSDSSGFISSSASTDRNDATYRVCQTGGGDSSTWSLQLPYSGVWRLYAIHNSADAGRTTDALYRVDHDEGSTTRHINQQTNSGQWNALGTFHFSIGTGSVELSSSAAGQTMVADAVRAVYLGTAFPFSLLSTY